jgi:hypothetical protein
MSSIDRSISRYSRELLCEQGEYTVLVTNGANEDKSYVALY